ncbi:hypothetical protein [Neobacillus terrae]|nr:hypothetical protein [Neobacillus terrae]NHM32640.1 hypothetical protein [Neobacillus terrae]
MRLHSTFQNNQLVQSMLMKRGIGLAEKKAFGYGGYTFCSEYFGSY